MYKTDDLHEVIQTDDPDGLEWPEIADVLDTKNGYQYHKWPCAYLDHSCDHWVIGGPDEVKQLIEDLTAILERWEKI